MTLGTNAETHGPPRHQRGEQDRDHTPDRAPWRPPAGGYHDKPCPVISGKLPALGTHHKGAENRATPNLLEKLRKSASAPATQQQGKETQATCRLAGKIARAQSHHRQGKEGGKTQVEAAEPKPTTATDPEDGGIGTPNHPRKSPYLETGTAPKASSNTTPAKSIEEVTPSTSSAPKVTVLLSATSPTRRDRRAATPRHQETGRQPRGRLPYLDTGNATTAGRDTTPAHEPAGPTPQRQASPPRRKKPKPSNVCNATTTPPTPTPPVSSCPKLH